MGISISMTYVFWGYKMGSGGAAAGAGGAGGTIITTAKSSSPGACSGIGSIVSFPSSIPAAVLAIYAICSILFVPIMALLL